MLNGIKKEVVDKTLCGLHKMLSTTSSPFVFISLLLFKSKFKFKFTFDYFLFEDYSDKKKWAEKMLVNIAKGGFFSSDRTINQYN